MDTKLGFLVYDFYFESLGRIHLSTPIGVISKPYNENGLLV
jgi:hypothetical protein